jgi:hypothetical protein
MFAPTRRPLAKGDGYFSNHDLFFPGFAYGLTRNVSVGGGFSTIPGLGLDEQLFYVSTQAGFKLSDKAAVAVGGLYAAGTDESLNLGVLYGVATLGHPNRSLTFGFALGATREEEAEFGPGGRYLGSHQTWSSRPILMVGGTLGVAKHASLVSESWLFLGRPVSEPLRPGRAFSPIASPSTWIRDRAELIDEGLPAWLSFTYHSAPHGLASAEVARAPACGAEAARTAAPRPAAADPRPAPWSTRRPRCGRAEQPAGGPGRQARLVHRPPGGDCQCPCERTAGRDARERCARPPILAGRRGSRTSSTSATP